jgi:hypothetical protein
MWGVILIVQVVHYPLFRHVGAERYATYQAEHMRRIAWVVGPAMTVELGTGVLIAWWQPLGIPAWQAWTGLGLLAFIWMMTGLVQAPIHGRLTGGFDQALHRRLVLTNWGRTVAWTLRSALVLWMVAPLVAPR